MPPIPPCIFCDLTDDIAIIQDWLNAIENTLVCEPFSYLVNCDTSLPTFEEITELIINVLQEFNRLCDLTDSLDGEACFVDGAATPCKLEDGIFISSDASIIITRLPFPDCRYDFIADVEINTDCPLVYDVGTRVLSMDYNIQHFDCTGDQLNLLIPDGFSQSVSNTNSQVVATPSAFQVRTGSAIVVPGASPTGQGVVHITWEVTMRRLGTASTISGFVNFRVRKNGAPVFTYANNWQLCNPQLAGTDPFDLSVTIPYSDAPVVFGATYDLEFQTLLGPGAISVDIELRDNDITLIALSSI